MERKVAVDLLVPVDIQALILIPLDVVALDDQVAYRVVKSVLMGGLFIAHKSSLV